MDNKFDTMLNPEKSGYIQCPHCNGYGSSLKDPEGVNICTRCGGAGLITYLYQFIISDLVNTLK
jgi:DNA-directed RNA polymerase subunit RPC12/RpoP